MAGLIVSDVDGVVLDFYKGAARVLKDMLGREMTVVDNRPATRYRYGLTQEQYLQMRQVMRTHEHGWRNLPTLDGAVEGIHKLMAYGFEVVFLSSCGNSLYDLRRENLDRIGLEECPLICVEDADKNAKGVVLDKLRPLAFIDDHMKMLAQAVNVPTRVWIDHGCALEIGPDGTPYIHTHQVLRYGSLGQWVNDFLEQREELNRGAQSSIPVRTVTDRGLTQLR